MSQTFTKEKKNGVVRQHQTGRVGRPCAFFKRPCDASDRKGRQETMGKLDTVGFAMPLCDEGHEGAPGLERGFILNI